MFPASNMIFLSNGNFPSLNGRRKQIVEGNVYIGLWYVSCECFLNNLYQFIQTIFIHWVFFQVYFGKLLFLELEIPKFLTFQTCVGITALFLTYIISTQLFFLLPISPIFLSDLPLQSYNLNWSLILDISHFNLLN